LGTIVSNNTENPIKLYYGDFDKKRKESIIVDKKLGKTISLQTKDELSLPNEFYQ
jgi:hypothetical protein